MSFFPHSGIEADIKIFSEEFAMRWRGHGAVCCGHFEHSQSAAGEWSPMSSLPLGITHTAEYRNMANIRFQFMASACPITQPIVVSGPVLVRDRMSLSKAQIKQAIP